MGDDSRKALNIDSNDNNNSNDSNKNNGIITAPCVLAMQG